MMPPRFEIEMATVTGTKRWMSALPALLVLLGGCMHFQPLERDDIVSELPEPYRMYASPSPVIGPWWAAFGQTELDGLVRKALGEGFTIRQAWSRLRQAHALAAKSRSFRYPDLNFDGGAAVTRRDGESRTNAGPPLEKETESYALGLGSSYELDLWGRVGANAKATEWEAQAAALDLQSAAMTISIRVAETWFSLVAQRAQRDVLHKQLEANRDALELIELRFRYAQATALDVYQQQQLVAETEGQIPLVEARATVLENALAILVGELPGAPFAAPPGAALPELRDPPERGLPADILAARPDVQAAGHRLQAADWQVAAARADRLPAIRLTARGAYESGEIDTLFDNWLLNLAAGLTGPLFDAGRRSAEVERARAEADRRLSAYRETVYNAFREVQDALVRERKQQEHLAAVQRQLAAARKAHREAGERYLKGLNDYLPVLTALVSQQRLEQSLVQKQYDLLTYRLALHRALGGDWMSSLTPNGFAQEEEKESP